MNQYVGGCGRKLSANKLSVLLKASGFDTASDSFADAVPFDHRGALLASSVDLIFDLGLGPELTGEIAVVHALSDLYAALHAPLSATFCLGAPARAFEDGRAAALLSSARDALAGSGALFGGGHTVYNDVLFLSVSALGASRLSQPPRIDPSEEYTLVLSKPVGTGVYLSANRDGLLTDDDLRSLATGMRQSNENAADELVRVQLSDDSSIAAVTDVTGFGLIQSVKNLVPQGSLAHLRVLDVPLFPRVIELVEQHGITTNLGEASLLSAMDSDAISLRVDDLGLLTALTDPQTSGGLLAAVSSQAARQLGSDWVPVGNLAPVSCASSVFVRVE